MLYNKAAACLQHPPVDKWTTNSTELQSEVINNAKLEDNFNGNYTCHFSVLRNSNIKTTELFLLVNCII